MPRYCIKLGTVTDIHAENIEEAQSLAREYAARNVLDLLDVTEYAEVEAETFTLPE